MRPESRPFLASEGLEHAVEVDATSLYEAAVMALEEFRRCGFADSSFGPGTRLTVKVKSAGDGACR